MTVRLSHSSLTGTSRTEVAVGTVSDTSMFCTVRAGAPRSTVYVGSSLAAAGAAGRDSFGIGLVVPLAGSAALVVGRGLATGAGVGVGSACARRARRGGLLGRLLGGLRRRAFAEPGPGPRLVAVGGAVRASTASTPLAEPLVWKYVAHVASTLPGSRWYWSYISSTSHSFAPKSAEGTSD